MISKFNPSVDLIDDQWVRMAKDAMSTHYSQLGHTIRMGLSNAVSGINTKYFRRAVGVHMKRCEKKLGLPSYGDFKSIILYYNRSGNGRAEPRAYTVQDVVESEAAIKGVSINKARDDIRYPNLSDYEFRMVLSPSTEEDSVKGYSVACDGIIIALVGSLFDAMALASMIHLEGDREGLRVFAEWYKSSEFSHDGRYREQHEFVDFRNSDYWHQVLEMDHRGEYE